MLMRSWLEGYFHLYPQDAVIPRNGQHVRLEAVLAERAEDGQSASVRVRFWRHGPAFRVHRDRLADLDGLRTVLDFREVRP